MDLIKQPRTRAVYIPQIRETRQTVVALAREAAKAGISSSEAIRQLIQAYLNDPWPLAAQKERGGRTAVWAAIKTTPHTKQALASLAARYGVSSSDAVRQIVRRFLLDKNADVPPLDPTTAERLAAAMQARNEVSA